MHTDSRKTRRYVDEPGDDKYIPSMEGRNPLLAMLFYGLLVIILSAIAGLICVFNLSWLLWMIEQV